jgi:transposase
MTRNIAFYSLKTRFQNCRQLTCYAGVVLFEKTSGSSIKSGSRISDLANIQINTLLAQAARSAVREIALKNASRHLMWVEYNMRAKISSHTGRKSI